MRSKEPQTKKSIDASDAADLTPADVAAWLAALRSGSHASSEAVQPSAPVCRGRSKAKQRRVNRKPVPNQGAA